MGVSFCETRAVLTTSDEDFVCTIFISKLWGVTFARFLAGKGVSTCSRMRRNGGQRGSWAEKVTTYEFDRHLLVIEQIGPLKDDAKGTLANLLPDAVMNPDDI